MIKIRVGGVLKEKDIPGLCKAIMNDHALADEGDADPVVLKGTQMNAIVGIIQRGCVEICHPNSLNYIEDFCVNKSLSFDHVKLESDPANNKGRFFRPKTGVDITTTCDSNGNPALDHAAMSKVLGELRKLSTSSTVAGRKIAKVLDDNLSDIADPLPKIRVRS
jgi:hypothetical protein